jgi:hypothetical protein
VKDNTPMAENPSIITQDIRQQIANNRKTMLVEKSKVDSPGAEAEHPLSIPFIQTNGDIRTKIAKEICGSISELTL